MGKFFIPLLRLSESLRFTYRYLFYVAYRWRRRLLPNGLSLARGGFLIDWLLLRGCPLVFSLGIHRSIYHPRGWFLPISFKGVFAVLNGRYLILFVLLGSVITPVGRPKLTILAAGTVALTGVTSRERISRDLISFPDLLPPHLYTVAGRAPNGLALEK